MKKFKIIGLSLAFCLLLSFSAMLSGNAFTAFANKNIATINDVGSLSSELFGNVKIESSEYLYNLDDSPDFAYVNFKEGGYAVYFAETMELLEYSQEGSLPYENAGARKYYGGPANYS